LVALEDAREAERQGNYQTRRLERLAGGDKMKGGLSAAPPAPKVPKDALLPVVWPPNHQDELVRRTILYFF
jgi:hypothetical protein